MPNDLWIYNRVRSKSSHVCVHQFQRFAKGLHDNHGCVVQASDAHDRAMGAGVVANQVSFISSSAIFLQLLPRHRELNARLLSMSHDEGKEESLQDKANTLQECQLL